MQKGKFLFTLLPDQPQMFYEVNPIIRRNIFIKYMVTPAFINRIQTKSKR